MGCATKCAPVLYYSGVNLWLRATDEGEGVALLYLRSNVTEINVECSASAEFPHGLVLRSTWPTTDNDADETHVPAPRPAHGIHEGRAASAQPAWAPNKLGRANSLSNIAK